MEEKLYSPKTESNIQQEHLKMFQTIAEYEQELNVSPEECLVEMNYSTAHWQPKERITPEQVEAVYNHITDNQRIGFEGANEMRQSVGKVPLTADEYYNNIKNMAYVKRFTFGDENFIDIKAIQSALNEVPTEYVLSQLSDEQRNLFADYYEASIDFAGNSEVNLSAAEQQLYETIINIRKSSSEIRKLQNEPSNKILNKSYYQTLLNEESLWKVGESDTFSYKGENFVLKKENADNREVYSVYKDETAAPLYQYESMETTLLNLIAAKDADKSIYSSEVTVYFDGDNVSITDKYDRQITLQPADNYSYNNIEEYLNGIAEIYPEYKPYIEKHLDELSSDYVKAIQAASYESKSVRLSQLEADMYTSGGYGEDSANSRTEAEIERLKNELEPHNIKFVWNGIKIDETLYKGSYGNGPYTETSKLPEGTITIYMKGSNTPRIDGLNIQNDSDIMTDYFENDTIHIYPGEVYFGEASKALNDYQIHQEKAAIKQYEKGFARSLGTNMEEYYANELAKHRAKLSELESQSGKSKSARRHNKTER